MRTKTLEVRVEFLESAVAGLVDVPRQIQALSAQILQVRGDLRDGLSAVRGETREMAETLRDEMREMSETLRADVRQDLGNEIDRLDMTLRAEIRSVEANLATHMRVLHEEVLDRIATLGEGADPAKPARKPTTGSVARRTGKPKP